MLRYAQSVGRVALAGNAHRHNADGCFKPLARTKGSLYYYNDKLYLDCKHILRETKSVSSCTLTSSIVSLRRSAMPCCHAVLAALKNQDLPIFPYPIVV
jgi:hypothetical protein